MKRLIPLLLALTILIPSSAGSWGVITIAGGVATVVSAPTLTSATIPAAGTSISLLFSESVTVGAGGNAGWSATLDVQGATTMTYASGSGSTTLVYNLNKTIGAEETGTVAYTQPGNGIEATTGGADVATIASAAITNNSTVSLNQFTVAASATASSLYASYYDHLAIDGNTTNEYRWQGAAEAYAGCYWQYDLGATYAHAIKRVIIYDYTDVTYLCQLKGFKIQGATAAAPTTWVDLSSPTGNQTETGAQTFNFTNTTNYRYIRIQPTDNGWAPLGFGIAQIGLWLVEVKGYYYY